MFTFAVETNKYKSALITFVFLVDFNKYLNACDEIGYIIEAMCSEPFKETLKISRFFYSGK